MFVYLESSGFRACVLFAHQFQELKKGGGLRSLLASIFLVRRIDKVSLSKIIRHPSDGGLGQGLRP
jgi:hypothetical protein